MAEHAAEIERIVREVLASLPSAAPLESRLQPAKKDEEQLEPKKATGDLVIGRSVVSLADLPERLNGIHRVVVGPRTVVTPSVRDVLQHKRIALTYGDPAAANPAGRAKVTLVSVGTRIDPEPLAKCLQTEGSEVTIQRNECLIAATDKLAVDLASETLLAVLLSEHTAAAVCLANRHAGMRAILGTRADTVAADAAAVGANLLVLDPVAGGFFPARQIASRFLRGGPRKCPEVFRGRLS